MDPKIRKLLEALRNATDSGHARWSAVANLANPQVGTEVYEVKLEHGSVRIKRALDENREPYFDVEVFSGASPEPLETVWVDTGNEYQLVDTIYKAARRVVKGLDSQLDLLIRDLEGYSPSSPPAPNAPHPSSFAKANRP